MKIIEHVPIGVRAQCVVCGLDAGPFVDTGYGADGGSVVCTKLCAGKIAAALGCASVDESAELREHVATVNAECDQLRAELRAARRDAALVEQAKAVQAHARGLVSTLPTIVGDEGD